MGFDAVEVRLFEPDEWAQCKAIRLRALQSDPAVFGSTYAKEKGFPDERWQASIARPDVGVFGVFHYGDLIGMTGITRVTEPETGELSDAAKLWGSWLEPSWRGKGVSKKMYAARLDWAREQPGVARVIVSHRESNTASKQANQKHGFVQTHSEDFHWHDGVTEPEVFYALDIISDT